MPAGGQSPCSSRCCLAWLIAKAVGGVRKMSPGLKRLSGHFKLRDGSHQTNLWRYETACIVRMPSMCCKLRQLFQIEPSTHLGKFRIFLKSCLKSMLLLARLGLARDLIINNARKGNSFVFIQNQETR
jgi:hypothetical protein